MSFTIEVESQVAAARLFRAIAVDWHTLGPKLVPEILTAGALEGEAKIGSVRQLNFTSAGYLKERLDLVDYENLEYKSTVVEGFNLGKTLKSAGIHFKFIPKSSGGSVSLVSAHFEALPGVDASGEVARGEKTTREHLKAVEAHLLATPTAYA